MREELQDNQTDDKRMETTDDVLEGCEVFCEYCENTFPAETMMFVQDDDVEDRCVCGSCWEAWSDRQDDHAKTACAADAKP